MYKKVLTCAKDKNALIHYNLRKELTELIKLRKYRRYDLNSILFFLADASIKFSKKVK